eukprot:SAG11_NODE_13859_length_636_cov_0.478585_1_plen_48_part_01
MTAVQLKSRVDVFGQANLIHMLIAIMWRLWTPMLPHLHATAGSYYMKR